MLRSSLIQEVVRRRKQEPSTLAVLGLAHTQRKYSPNLHFEILLLNLEDHHNTTSPWVVSFAIRERYVPKSCRLHISATLLCCLGSSLGQLPRNCIYLPLLTSNLGPRLYLHCEYTSKQKSCCIPPIGLCRETWLSSWSYQGKETPRPFELCIFNSRIAPDSLSSRYLIAKSFLGNHS